MNPDLYQDRQKTPRWAPVGNELGGTPGAGDVANSTERHEDEEIVNTRGRAVQNFRRGSGSDPEETAAARPIRFLAPLRFGVNEFYEHSIL